MEQAVTSPDVVQRVEQLQSDYAACIDDERYAEWPAFFTERCLYTITTRENHRKQQPFGFMFCDSRAMLRDRIASMRNANIFEPHTYRHVLGRASVRTAEDGALTARTSYIVVRTMHDGTQELFSTGVYLDRLVQDEGALRFAERVVVCDSSRIDALLVIPF
jgi:anthranilate 1,2-dioxygenase small subunit